MGISKITSYGEERGKRREGEETHKHTQEGTGDGGDAQPSTGHALHGCLLHPHAIDEHLPLGAPWVGGEARGVA